MQQPNSPQGHVLLPLAREILPGMKALLSNELLVGMQISAATMEINMEVLQKN
jgi:hypothetical protein